MVGEGTLELWEFLSYVVTVLGLPIALLAVWREMRAERANEAKEIEQREDQIYVQLSQQYSAFLETVLANPELDLLSEEAGVADLTPGQRRQRDIYYEMLMALFERAYILLYEEAQDAAGGGRRWGSWSDFIAYWLRRPDFRAYAIDNLAGEDPAFAGFIRAKLSEPMTRGQDGSLAQEHDGDAPVGGHEGIVREQRL